mmetsp:Transcript_44695/g.106547  ORF Transcript_44695/g.106547 Transcript_44695/m.106547 type:complete len:208 (-) Transcript_44695:1777-2400(-)
MRASCTALSCSRALTTSEAYSARRSKVTTRLAPPGNSSTWEPSVRQVLKVHCQTSWKRFSAIGCPSSSRNWRAFQHARSVAWRSSTSSSWPTSAFHTREGRSSESRFRVRIATAMSCPTKKKRSSSRGDVAEGRGTNLSRFAATALAALAHGTSRRSCGDCSSVQSADSASRYGPWKPWCPSPWKITRHAISSRCRSRTGATCRSWR